MPNKRKSELVRPVYSVITPTSSWAREEMTAELGISLEAYDERYRRGDDMPERYRSGPFWRHLIVDYQQWQREQVAKAEAERKRLTNKRKRTKQSANEVANTA